MDESISEVDHLKAGLARMMLGYEKVVGELKADVEKERTKVLQAEASGSMLSRKVEELKIVNEDKKKTLVEMTEKQVIIFC